MQDHAWQLEIYEVFNLAIPHGNFYACYNINRYLGIMHDEAKAVEISEDQFNICQKVNGQFGSLNTPLLSLMNPPMCIAALYANDKAGIKKRCSPQIRKTNSVSIPTPITPNVWILTSAPTAVSLGIMLICPEEAPRFSKTQTPIHVLQLLPACSATTQHFHLPPRYETHKLTINISLNTANLNVINISSLEFRIWQHLEDHWNGIQLYHFVNMLSVPIDQFYKQMVSSKTPINPFMSTDDVNWGVYIMAIGLLKPVELGIFSCYFFWCQPARLACWPLQSGSTWYTIVDDNVEAAPIYRCDDKAGQAIVRPHENHVLHMEWEPTWMESWQKQQTQSKAVPASGSLDTNLQNLGNMISTYGLFSDFSSIPKQFDILALKNNSCFTQHHYHMCTTNSHLTTQ